MRLPLGTKLYPVTLDIEASKMAKVYVDGTAASNLYDPDAKYDVNDAVKITVVSEDGNTTKTYTLNAVVSDSFNDVPTSEWYYDEVMTAANAAGSTAPSPATSSPTAP